MAQFPCDMDQLPYRGPQQTAYPALVHSGEQIRMKRRMCPSCFGALQTWMKARLARADQMELFPVCAICDSEHPEAAIFITSYAAHSEREDWYGRVCLGSCWDEADAFLFGEFRGA